MSTPEHEYRFEHAVEVPGTPQQVWDAIATGGGISSWFLRTEVEQRVGGRIVTYMGETDSPGTVTGWDPPQRFAYEEPEWAQLAGHDIEGTTPLATEFLVEATSGGTCVVRVVSSAFASGAEWEREFFEEMGNGWRPFFDRLRLYLTHFPGQQATLLSVEGKVPLSPSALVAAARKELEARGLTDHVEQDSDDVVLVRLTGEVPGFLAISAWPAEDGSAHTVVQGQLFSDGARGYVEREEPVWRAWVASQR